MKRILLLAFLSASILNAMEEKTPQPKRKREETKSEEAQQPALKKMHFDEKFLEDCGLEYEKILEILKVDSNPNLLDQANDSEVDFNPNLFDQANDIYEGVEIIEKICKDKPKQYISLLTEKFLEKREGKEGLYPKNNKWVDTPTINEDIATFILTGVMQNNFWGDSEMLKIALPKKLLKLLLFLGLNPNMQSASDCYSLPYIISCPFNKFENPIEKIEITKLLLECGANPNIQTGKPPCLHYLAFSASSSSNRNLYLLMAKLLLNYNANPNLQEKYGRTALHFATNLRQSEMILLLLKHGAKINLQDNYGMNPLSMAVTKYQPTEHNNIETITLLLQNGANPLAKDRQGKTAFDIARERKFTEFELLVRKHSQNTLKNICRQRILTNLSLFEDRLDTLPLELQEQINNLKS